MLHQKRVAPLGLCELLGQSAPFISTLGRRELFGVGQGFHTGLEQHRGEKAAGRSWGQRSRVPRQGASRRRGGGGEGETGERAEGPRRVGGAARRGQRAALGGGGCGA